MNTDKLEIIRIPGVGGILLTLGFFGCIINGVDEKIYIFSQCHLLYNSYYFMLVSIKMF